MSDQFIKKLNDSESLTDILIQMEDFLDSLDIYVFKNWFEGEIVEGPEVRRYWVSMTLKYDYDKMPDPAGAERLLKSGTKVIFRKSSEKKPVEVKGPDDLEPNKKPKMEDIKIWLVEIQIPRRFIEELDDADLENTDEPGIDAEKVSDARDENIDKEAAFTKEGAKELSGDEEEITDSDEELGGL